MTKTIRILIACHKKCEVATDSIYMPIQVGAKGKESIGFLRDDTGVNISGKNNLYCELTGLYWAWKNLNYDYLGLVHYRRYFKLRLSHLFGKSNLSDVLTEEDTILLLQKYKIIVPKKRRYFIESCYSHYAHTFDGKQFDIAREVIKDMYPDYLNCFDRFMKGDSCWLFNMFIMDRSMVDKYCNWLFPILEEIDRRYEAKDLTDFEKRYLGRVGERLFNVWLLYQISSGAIEQKEICELPYIYIGDIKWFRKIVSFLEAKFLHKKYSKSF